MSSYAGLAKETMRARLLSRRRSRGETERELVAKALAFHAAALGALANASSVAAYLSMPSEPNTEELIDSLLARGIEVLVPKSWPDRSMTWVKYPSAAVSVGDLGVPEPDSSAESGSLADCEFAFIPALAVDHHGNRLGRGAGYYDRALAEFAGVVCAVVFADELVEQVAAEPHDRRVDLVLTEAGVFRPEQP